MNVYVQPSIKQTLLPYWPITYHYMDCSWWSGWHTPAWGWFFLYVLTLTPSWINNHIPCKLWDEITYPFRNFNCCTVEVLEWISNFTPHSIYSPLWEMEVQSTQVNFTAIWGDNRNKAEILRWQYRSIVNINIYLYTIKEHYHPLYQTCKSTYLEYICQRNRPTDRGQVVNPRPLTLQGQPYTKPEPPL